MDENLRTLTSKILSSVGILIIVGTLFYKVVEKFTWIDSFYFTIITLTTVGYGDLSPQTDIGKVFTVFYVVVGVGMFAYFINGLAKRRGERALDRQKAKNKEQKKNDKKK